MNYSDDLESETAAGGKVLELDVHVKPRGDLDHTLALYAEGKRLSPLPMNLPLCLPFHSNTFLPVIENLPTDGNEANGHQGFLEKNLSDFFDI